MRVDEDKAIMNNGLQGPRILRDPERTSRVGPRRPQCAENLRTLHRLSDSLNCSCLVFVNDWKLNASSDSCKKSAVYVKYKYSNSNFLEH